MGHSIEYKTPAQKELDTLSGDIHGRILKAIGKLKDNPRPPGCEKLKTRDAYRIRVGDYRNFEEVVAKARIACKNSQQLEEDHFVDVNEMVPLGT